jgi:polysaccharide export outer membrane protein
MPSRALIRLPQTFNVFGATGRNAEIPFDADTINLAEALGKSQGLHEALAKPVAREPANQAPEPHPMSRLAVSSPTSGS